MIRVGIVDDDEKLADLLADEVDDETLTTSDPEVAVDWVERDQIDSLFTDLKMKPVDGLQLLEKIRSVDRKIPIVMMTGHATVSTAVEAMKAGATDYIQKPLEGEEFRAIVRRIEEQVRDQRKLEGFRENQRARDDVENRLLGDSDRLKELREKIGNIAPQPMSVLVKGETGTGKEIIARQIHSQSDRSDAPLMTVNCAAIPGNLLEEELFGHQKGAFTGADETKKGKLELADGGTVFLDEIGELPIKLQPKLLRVLEQGEVTKVGGEFPRSVDVRFIAATNRDLKQMIQDDQFRKDLFYRLNSFEVIAPPLRDHRDDIELLAEHFIEKMRGKLSEKPTLTSGALEKLESYSWPGNVRELRNVIERSAVLTDGDKITLEDLPDELIQGGEPSVGGFSDWRQFGETLPDAIEAIELQIIENSLENTGGNKAEAARKLGISRQSLQYKLDNREE